MYWLKILVFVLNCLMFFYFLGLTSGGMSFCILGGFLEGCGLQQSGAGSKEWQGMGDNCRWTWTYKQASAHLH